MFNQGTWHTLRQMTMCTVWTTSTLSPLPFSSAWKHNTLLGNIHCHSHLELLCHDHYIIMIMMIMLMVVIMLILMIWWWWSSWWWSSWWWWYCWWYWWYDDDNINENLLILTSCNNTMNFASDLNEESYVFAGLHKIQKN